MNPTDENRLLKQVLENKTKAVEDLLKELMATTSEAELLTKRLRGSRKRCEDLAEENIHLRRRLHLKIASPRNPKSSEVVRQINAELWGSRP